MQITFSLDYISLTKIDVDLGRVLHNISRQFVLVVDFESMSASLALSVDRVATYELQPVIRANARD